MKKTVRRKEKKRVLLAFETTSKYVSVALLVNGAVKARIHRDMGLNHASQLIPTIDRVMKRARVRLDALDALAVSIGPGSFTGLRISVATAKALAKATGVKIAAVPTLDVIAYNFRHQKGMIAPLIDARKQRVYTAFYKADGQAINRVSDYFLTDIDSVFKKVMGRNIVLFGDAVGLYKDQIAKMKTGIPAKASDPWYPRADAAGILGNEMLSRGDTCSGEDLAPMYLYPKECNVKGFTW